MIELEKGENFVFAEINDDNLQKISLLEERMSEDKGKNIVLVAFEEKKDKLS